MIQSIKAISTYFTDQLDLLTTLNQAGGPPPYIPTTRWPDKNLPVRVFLENADSTQKANFEWSMNDTYNKTGGALGFREANSDSSEGIHVLWVPSDSSILAGGLARTIIDNISPQSHSIEHASIYASNNETRKGIDEREIGRSTYLWDKSPDQIMIMFEPGVNVDEWSKDQEHTREN